MFFFSTWFCLQGQSVTWLHSAIRSILNLFRVVSGCCKERLCSSVYPSFHFFSPPRKFFSSPLLFWHFWMSHSHWALSNFDQFLIKLFQPKKCNATFPSNQTGKKSPWRFYTQLWVKESVPTGYSVFQVISFELWIFRIVLCAAKFLDLHQRSQPNRSLSSPRNVRPWPNQLTAAEISSCHFAFPASVSNRFVRGANQNTFDWNQVVTKSGFA